MKRAIVISHNWKTHETLHEEFIGEGCADSAAGWRDFPEIDGWDHFSHWNKAAGEERGKRIADELCNKGTLTETVPK